MPTPAFAIPSRREQLLNEPRVIFASRRQLLLRRRQADEIKRCPPHERPHVGRLRRDQVVLAQLAFDQKVDWMSVRCDRGWRDRLKGPMPLRGRFDVACREMQALVTLEPHYYWGWQQLAGWYNETGKSESYLEAAEKLAANYPDCAHDFPPEVREAAYGFLDRWLK